MIIKTTQTMDKRPIQSLSDLRQEQARLRTSIQQSEQVIGHQLDFFRRHFPSILLMQVLPYDERKKDIIISGLGFAASILMGRLAETGKDMFEKNIHAFIHRVSSKFGGRSNAEKPKED
jgi:hypothetical protein